MASKPLKQLAEAVLDGVVVGSCAYAPGSDFAPYKGWNFIFDASVAKPYYDNTQQERFRPDARPDPP